MQPVHPLLTLSWQAPFRQLFMTVKRSICVVVCGVASLALCGSATAGDQTYKFTLSSGGELRGTLQNESEVPRQTYVIETELGTITLDRDQVVSRDPISDARLEYEKIQSDYPDTAEGHWELAQWCRENMLSQERLQEARKVIEHDPDHLQARGLLGHFLDRSQGKWITREQLREQQGYVRYDGEWLLPQQVILREEYRIAEEARVRWIRQVALLHRQLTGRQVEEGRDGLLRIQDPAAIPALEPHLQVDQEPNPLIRELYVQSLSNIGGTQALSILANVVLSDPSEEVTFRAINEIAKHQDPKITRMFVKKLTANKNEEINRAAAALGAIGDVSAVGPLIGSLITEHTKIHTSGNPDQITSSFSPQGGSNLSTGSRTETETRIYRNEHVRNALISLTGKSAFGYDMDLWKTWYAAQTEAVMVDARRGN